jgi:hypothetical protein
MADNAIVAILGKAFPAVKADQKTRETITLSHRVKRLLGISNWSELIKGDEPYFGF